MNRPKSTGSLYSNNVDSGGGDIGANIYKQGLDAKEVISLLESLLKNDPRLEIFKDELEQFERALEILYEWKKLHNALDDIWSALWPFLSEVRRLDINREKPHVESITIQWAAVSQRVDFLIEIASEIQYIGDPYTEDQDGSMRGEKAVVDLNGVRRQIDHQLHQIGSDYSKHSNASVDNIFQLGKFGIDRLTGNLPDWWIGLPEIVNQFNNYVYFHLHRVDKKLLESADTLNIHSRLIFRS